MNYEIINLEEHQKIQTTPFNEDKNGLETPNTFSDKFNNEIGQAMEVFKKYFEQHGKFASLERYDEGLPSDWWIGDDFYSTSRVLFIDILNTKLISYDIILGAQKELKKLESNWMLMVGHDNDYDDKGEHVGKPGEYYFWITIDSIKVYSERPEDIAKFTETVR